MAERHAALTHALVGERRVEVAGPQESAERPAHLQGAQPGAVAEPSAEVLEDRPDRHAELDLDDARPGDGCAQRDELRAGARARAAAREGRSPRATIQGTAHRVSTLLTAVGRRPRPSSAGYGGRTWAPPRAPSSDAISAVSSPATYDPAPTATSTSKSIPEPWTSRPRCPSRARLGDGRPEGVASGRVLRADVGDAVRRAAGQPGERQALQHAVGVALHQQPVGERARVALVPVRHDVARRAGPRLAHRAPLARDGEGRAAPAREPGELDLVRAGARRLRRGRAARPPRRRGPEPVDPGERDRLVNRRPDRDRGRPPGRPSQRLPGELRPGARRLADERRRSRVAVAQAAHAPHETPGPLRRGRELVQVGAAGAGEARRAGARADLVRPPRGGQVGVVARHAVDVGPGQAELAGDPREAGRIEAALRASALAEALEQRAPAPPVAALQVDHMRSPGGHRRRASPRRPGAPSGRPLTRRAAHY